ncbi:MAG TPA: MotA/TolQ/ExbB proton channel family protein [Oligoflexia bacterium]|nr:MotA/TolQ/ExbB proton channel family protein [Oligoflexia bacterium]HMP48875.1 MotA/TolQ/ExbB proton channel family protein [Oligoflexia bacterium]
MIDTSTELIPDVFTPLTLLLKGGWVMFLILLCSLASLGLIISKVKQFFQLKIKDTTFINPLMAKLEKEGVDAALQMLESSKQHQAGHPVAKVMKNTIELCNLKLESSDAFISKSAAKPCAGSCLRFEDIEAEIARIGSAELRSLDTGLRGLCAIAQMSPLLGLLGTVLGMITAFMTIQTAGNAVSPALLAGGIWNALLTTAFGLIVAVPSMSAYYYLEGLVDEASAAMRDGTERVLLHFKKETRRPPEYFDNFATEKWREHAN